MWRRHKNHRARSGTTGAAAVTAKGFARSNRAYTKSRRKLQPARQRYAVSDGRDSVGSAVPHGAREWKALDTRGVEIGTYTSLLAAVRALPAREGRAR